MRLASKPAAATVVIPEEHEEDESVPLLKDKSAPAVKQSESNFVMSSQGLKERAAPKIRLGQPPL